MVSKSLKTLENSILFLFINFNMRKGNVFFGAHSCFHPNGQEKCSRITVKPTVNFLFVMSHCVHMYCHLFPLPWKKGWPEVLLTCDRFICMCRSLSEHAPVTIFSSPCFSREKSREIEKDREREKCTYRGWRSKIFARNFPNPRSAPLFSWCCLKSRCSDFRVLAFGGSSHSCIFALILWANTRIRASYKFEFCL